MIGALAADEARARAGAGKLVISERELQCRVDRLGAGVGEEDAVEIAWRQRGQTRGQREGGGVPHLERRRIVEAPDLAGDSLDNRLPAMAGVATPQPRHGVEQFAAVRRVVVHALGPIDEPWPPLEGAIGGEREPIGVKIGGVEPGCGGSV